MLFGGWSQQSLLLHDCLHLISFYIYFFLTVVLPFSTRHLILPVSLIPHSAFTLPILLIMFLLPFSLSVLTPSFSLVSRSVSPKAFCSHFLFFSLIGLLSLPPSLAKKKAFFSHKKTFWMRIEYCLDKYANRCFNSQKDFSNWSPSTWWVQFCSSFQ